MAGIVVQYDDLLDCSGVGKIKIELVCASLGQGVQGVAEQLCGLTARYGSVGGQIDTLVQLQTVGVVDVVGGPDTANVFGAVAEKPQKQRSGLTEGERVIGAKQAVSISGEKCVGIGKIHIAGIPVSGKHIPEQCFLGLGIHLIL